MHSAPCCVSNPATPRAPASCHWRCAPGVVDDLLRVPGAATGEEVDLLLEFRWHLQRREDATAAVRLFCDLRRRMEARHYLAFFRIRRWLENHVRVAVRGCPLQAPHFTPLRLDYYCFEAINRSALCAVLSHGVSLLAPRVAYEFLAPSEPAPARSGAADCQDEAAVEPAFPSPSRLHSAPTSAPV